MGEGRPPRQLLPGLLQSQPARVGWQGLAVAATGCPPAAVTALHSSCSWLRRQRVQGSCRRPLAAQERAAGRA
jgi:hypothetical protein